MASAGCEEGCGGGNLQVLGSPYRNAACRVEGGGPPGERLPCTAVQSCGCGNSSSRFPVGFPVCCLWMLCHSKAMSGATPLPPTSQHGAGGSELLIPGAAGGKSSLTAGEQPGSSPPAQGAGHPP